ncbi:leucine-rich repeat neuronal protein 4 [Poecilia reticulata]|uniref:Leucine-rich repeat neuronal protein 4-like n=1 Tax=Poecilia reticulata TaxID=8081 RepID=A0A3P9QJU4_POERE|nr:PREDICTED: leucine-rich repeat neuronal protein 4-like [Poecilia reticulata]
MTKRPFPLVIACLLSIRGFSPLSSAGTGEPPRNPVIPTEDYDILDEISTPTMTTSTGTLPRCDYHSCRENQTPCEDLAASHGCSCPGFSLTTVQPDDPSLRSVTWNGSAVVVHWCAPYSYITSYVVTVKGGEKQIVKKDQRITTLKQIDHKAEVCVVAVNDVGESGPSCKEYTPASNSLPLAAGLIGGALGLLLLILLVVLLCRRRTQKKREAAHV